jgi:exopolyphosphatase/guanosine-5'-triphosphate,3'-diphosphate pyrophosphatase
MRLGVLDIGSNTVHLLVVDAYCGAAPVPAHSRKMELRLSEHMTPDGEIDSSAADGLTQFVEESKVIAEDLGVTETFAFATSAIREAANGEQVLRRVRKQTGVEITTLSGPEEARLTFLAVRRWFGWSAGRLIVFDIGGGSLEIAVGSDEEPDEALSLPLGAGRLTRERLPEDPPDAAGIRQVRRYVRAEIAGEVGRIQRTGIPERAVATSKTFRQLARIAGAAASSEGPFVPRSLKRQDISDWLPRLAQMTSSDRADLPGVSAGRSSQLVAGALVAEAALDLFGVDQVDICPWALREGVILRRLDGMRE